MGSKGDWNGIGSLVGLLAVACLAAGCSAAPAASDDRGDGVYSYQRPSRDGIGKVYMGREIAAVMGFEGAAWLERPARQRTELPDRVVAELGLAPTDVVADLGAGSGYFTFRLAELVPEGRVLAVDIQPEMLELLERGAAERRLPQVEPVLGTIEDPGLEPNTVDLALLVDAYHEFSHPREMMTALVRALVPGGRVVLVEYRGEDPRVPIKRLHKMTVEQVRRELDAVGLRWLETRDFLPQQHFLVFEKPRRGRSGRWVGYSFGQHVPMICSR